jgi:DNA-binding MarR family transcriptional regulator
MKEESLDLALNEQEEDYFTRVCTHVSECLDSGRTIAEREFLYISRRVIKFAASAIAEPLPSTFWDLEKSVSNYWRYEANSETDCKRGVTYARLYELTRFASLFRTIENQDNRLRIDAIDDKEYFDLLQAINGSPGISRKELHDRLSYSLSEIDSKIRFMEDKGYLLVQRVITNVYYQLSFAGTCLLNRMRENKKKAILSSRFKKVCANQQAMQGRPIAQIMKDIQSQRSSPMFQDYEIHARQIVGGYTIGEIEKTEERKRKTKTIGIESTKLRSAGSFRFYAYDNMNAWKSTATRT